MPGGSFGTFRDSASHIWMGGGSSAARWANTSAKFSPACLSPLKNSVTLCPACVSATMPVVNMPVRSAAVSRCSDKILTAVSSL